MEYRSILAEPLPSAPPVEKYGGLAGLLDVDDLLLSLGGDLTELRLPPDIVDEEWFKGLGNKCGVALGKDEVECVSSLDRYVAMSLMQKGIRRKLWKPTAMAVHALYRMGKQADCIRRLKVIALEDVGNGDPQAAALALLLLNSAVDLRKATGLEAVTPTLMAARVLCFAWKSRDLCDLEVWMGMEPGCFEFVRDMQSMSVQEVKKAALDPEAAFLDRMLAFARLWNLKQCQPPKGAGIHDRMDVYADMDCPPSLVYASEMCLKGTGSTMGVGMPFAWRLMTEVTTELDAWPADNWAYEGLLAAALDKHTSKGKRSIAIWRKLKPLKYWFEKHQNVDSYASIMRAEFYVSAAVLEPRVSYPGSWDLYWQILDLKCRTTGFESLDEVVELFTLAHENLHQLNSLRFNLE